MRIGIFGGTFNPPHNGHKRLALLIKEKANLDRILIIPAGSPPHKEAKDLASSKDREEMCRLLFSESFFTVSDIETKREGKSYTFDTLTELKKIYPDDELFLIMGSDMLLSFHRWYKFKEILSMVTLCAFTREDEISSSVLDSYAKETLLLKDNEFITLSAEPMVVSSTEIREKIKSGEDTGSLLNEKVREYTHKFDLYSFRFPEYKLILRNLLDDYRYIHSLGVAKAAEKLSEIYGEERDKAYLAGLLHDIMKNAEKSFQLQIMEKGGIILNRVEKNNPALWHAMAGEAYLREEMGFADEDFLLSVRYHTTGKSNMTLLQKIIYIADYISEERNYPDVDIMRDLSYNVSLEEAALYSLKYSFKNLSENEKLIHPDSLSFYNELIINKRKEEAL